MTPRLVDEFRTLVPCCHVFCTSCVAQVFSRGGGPCPLCRTFIGPDLNEAVKGVLLEFVTTKEALAETVVDGLNRMDENSKAVSVVRAPAKLQKAADELDLSEDRDLAKSLIQAMTEFKERIVPVFKEAEKQKQKVRELQSELESHKDQSQAYDMKTELLTAKLRSLEDKMVEIRKSQGQVETERYRAVELAEKASNDLRTVRKDNITLSERVSVLEEETTSLKGYLQQYKAAERKSKVKRKEMQRRLAELEHKACENKGDTQNASAATLPAVVNLDEETRKVTTTKDPDPFQYSIEPRFDFEGMPGPGFASTWKPGEHRSVKKIKLSNDKVKEITNVPIALDKSGHPTLPVQLGPKRRLRTHNPLK
ncbi:hypothetical protein AX15_001026 [Amanita polypyramis BW_CC]|nr:hypothetical protein AX15_001026 [Amanita polypyramis BW_CC]